MYSDGRVCLQWRRHKVLAMRYKISIANLPEVLFSSFMYLPVENICHGARSCFIILYVCNMFNSFAAIPTCSIWNRRWLQKHSKIDPYRKWNTFQYLVRSQHKNKYQSHVNQWIQTKKKSLKAVTFGKKIT